MRALTQPLLFFCPAPAHPQTPFPVLHEANLCSVPATRCPNVPCRVAPRISLRCCAQHSIPSIESQGVHAGGQREANPQEQAQKQAQRTFIYVCIYMYDMYACMCMYMRYMYTHAYISTTASPTNITGAQSTKRDLLEYQKRPIRVPQKRPIRVLTNIQGAQHSTAQHSTAQHSKETQQRVSTPLRVVIDTAVGRQRGQNTAILQRCLNGSMQCLQRRPAARQPSARQRRRKRLAEK